MWEKVNNFGLIGVYHTKYPHEFHTHLALNTLHIQENNLRI